MPLVWGCVIVLGIWNQWNICMKKFIYLSSIYLSIICLSIYLSIHLSSIYHLFIHLSDQEFTLIFMPKPIPQNSLYFISFYICNYFLQQWKPYLPIISYMFTYSSPDWCDSVWWTQPCKAKSCLFDFRYRHVAWVWDLVPNQMCMYE